MVSKLVPQIVLKVTVESEETCFIHRRGAQQGPFANLLGFAYHLEAIWKHFGPMSDNSLIFVEEFRAMCPSVLFRSLSKDCRKQTTHWSEISKPLAKTSHVEPSEP